MQEESAQMESLDVIEKVTEPTDRVNSMVKIIKPKGSLRTCIDPRNLNQAIQWEHYPMQTIEQVTTWMPVATYFSVLDDSSGYWQISLDEESSKLYTFNSLFGWYMFKRFLFGLSSTWDIFQKSDDRNLWRYWWCRGCGRYHPCVGKNETEHDSRLIKVLDRAWLRNLKLNKTRCHFKKQEISYLIHV